MVNIRSFVFELLKKVSSDNSYSNLVLKDAFKGKEINQKEIALVTRIFYGVVERKLTLDYIISQYSNKEFDKLDKEVVIILEIALYQLKYMDSIHDNVVVNESVSFVKSKKKTSACGFVNAVLRNYIRDGKVIKTSNDKSFDISIEYSCSQELINMWLQQYSEDQVLSFLNESLSDSNIYIRVNTLKITSSGLIKAFNEIGISAEQSNILENALLIKNTGSIESCDLYKKGYFHVQDISSQLCCKALDVKEDQRILDICSAPGGKTFTIAELTGNKADITSCDLHKKRVSLIEQGCDRLGINCVTAIENDAKKFNDSIGYFDRILCDVPCSGFGVIRSKPEIKYKKLAEIDNLPQVQYDILCTASRYLNVGGELIYSTCTINKNENDNVIDKFLNNNKNFEKVNILSDLGDHFGDYKVTLFPSYFNSDGFFISKIRKLR